MRNQKKDTILPVKKKVDPATLYLLITLLGDEILHYQ